MRFKTAIITGALSCMLIGTIMGVSASANQLPVPKPLDAAAVSQQALAINVNKKTSGNYEYVVTNEQEKTAALYKINGAGGKLVIPQTIDGYKITYIGKYYTWEDAVSIIGSENNTITDIEIPEGVNTIGENAFGKMPQLKELKLPKSLNCIMEGNFTDCTKLKKLIFPGELVIYRSFNGVKFDKITVYDKVTMYLENATTVKKYNIMPKAFNQYVKSLPVKWNEQWLDVQGIKIDELIIPKNTYGIDTINVKDVKAKKIILNNPKVNIVGVNNSTIIESTVNVKGRLDKKTKKYNYSWKKANVSCNNCKTNIKYTVLSKNKKGKYVKLKITSNNKYCSDKKLIVKVKRTVKTVSKNTTKGSNRQYTAVTAPPLSVTLPPMSTSTTAPSTTVSQSPAPTQTPVKYSEPNEYYKALKRIESSGYEYVVTNENVKCATITKLKNYTDKIVIPKEIDGYKVTSIGLPYDDENDYEQLSKEDAITIYGENRDNLNGVNYIRRCILDYNDEKVSSIEIPEGITRISAGAFGKLKALKELKLPKSLTYIDNRNFLECVNLSELTVKGTLFVKNSFRGAGFDTITVYGDLICGDDEAVIGIDGKVNKLILKADSFNSSAKSKTRVLTLYDLNVGELIIPKNTNGITEINIETANIARITTANHNIKFTGRVNEKISSETKAKSKYNKKTKKYTFTWKKINYNSTNDGRYSVEKKTCKYTIYQKNKKGKYVKIKTTSLPKYITDKKAAVKVKCELNINRKNIFK